MSRVIDQLLLIAQADTGAVFTQVVTVSGAARTVYIGGQNGVDADGAIVGDGASADRPSRC